jgi:HEAT repeat protein
MRNVEFCSPSKAFACSILLLTAVCCGLAARPAKSQSEGMRYMDIVERLRSDDPAVRLTASRALIKAGGLATPELMRKLRDSLRQEPFEKRERTSSYTLELMNVLAETLERQPEVVSVFRNNDDCELAKALVKLATSNDKTTRGLATIILA